MIPCGISRLRRNYSSDSNVRPVRRFVNRSLEFQSHSVHPFRKPGSGGVRYIHRNLSCNSLRHRELDPVHRLTQCIHSFRNIEPQEMKQMLHLDIQDIIRHDRRCLHNRRQCRSVNRFRHNDVNAVRSGTVLNLRYLKLSSGSTDRLRQRISHIIGICSLVHRSRKSGCEISVRAVSSSCQKAECLTVKGICPVLIFSPDGDLVARHPYEPFLVGIVGRSCLRTVPHGQSDLDR